MARDQQKWKFAIIIILVGTTIGISNQKIVTVDSDTQVLTYTIKKARIIAEIINGFITTNYQFDKTSFPENTDVIVYTNIGAIGSATIEITKENASRVVFYTINDFKLILPRLVEETYLNAHSLYAWPEVRSFKDGYDLEMFPYIEPVAATWQFFLSFGQTMVNNFQQYRNQGYDVEFECSFFDDRNNYYFECWCGGEINGEYGATSVYPYKTPANVTFDNLYKMVINKQSGIVQGARVKGRVKGRLNDSEINVQEDYLYELKGYNLPSIKVGPNFIVDPYLGKKLAFIIPTIGTLSIGLIVSIIFIRKRKTKNKGIQN